MRHEVRQRRASGVSGISCCAWLSDQVDEFVREIVARRLESHPDVSEDAFVVVAVGGNGRRRPAPFSDVDLLFLVDARKQTAVEEFLKSVVRDCWDAGMQPGTSIRT